MKRAVLVVTHLVALAIGFAAGIYSLPILIAPPAPSPIEVKGAAGAARYHANFRRDLKGSDLLHWGEGTVSIGTKAVSFTGKLAPGPDYKLYFAPQYVETKDEFVRVKARSRRVGDVKTFENFIVPLPEAFDPAQYDTVVVWCETFSMFITSAKYR
ncbi:MAG TPA: DM13 domain-containing protein [Burkholderiales bacterium]|nr:DM13 domain-containing protein [Burkholderiales bacterium]